MGAPCLGPGLNGQLPFSPPRTRPWHPFQRIESPPFSSETGHVLSSPSDVLIVSEDGQALAEAETQRQGCSWDFLGEKMVVLARLWTY